MTDSNDLALLVQVDGVGPDKAHRLLEHFDTGRDVAIAASSQWSAISKVPGFSEDSASTLFGRMYEAGVYYPLKNESRPAAVACRGP